MKKRINRLLRTQAGRFAAGVVALVLAVVLVMCAGSMEFLRVDVTAQQVMTIDPAAKEIVRNVDQEVALYYLSSESGKDMWLDELLTKYDALSEYVHYLRVEPTSNMATEIAGMAGFALSENMLVVVSEDRLSIVAPEDFYRVTYDLMTYYTTGEMVEQSSMFVADEQIANAILYVTRDDMPTVYLLSGHGETVPGSVLREEIWKNNIDMQTLVLNGAVPENAAMVLIYAPLTDISKEEADALLAYVQAGGKLVVLTNYMLPLSENLDSVMAYYGMQPKYGIAVDTEAGRYYAEEVPYYLTPVVMRHEVTESLLTYSSTLLMPMSSAVERNETVRDTLKVSTLMTTSGRAYLKNPLTMKVLEKESGDPAGTFILAMAAEEGDSRVVWFAGSDFLNDENIEYSSQLNLYIFDGICEWMLPETAERIAIAEENLLDAATRVPVKSAAIVFTALFVPALAALIAGIALRPRKHGRASEE